MFYCLNSFMVLLVIASSLIPLINYFLDVCHSLYKYILSLILSLIIYSPTVSWSCLLNLQCWRGGIIWLCQGLNLLCKILKSPATMSHYFSSDFVGLNVSLRPSLPNQFLIGNLSASTLSQCFVRIVFISSTSTCLSSVYLSLAIQLNTSCLWHGCSASWCF